MAIVDVAKPKNMKLKVVRKEPELVGPVEATPHEIKQVSDIDDQEGLRFQMTGIMFYRVEPSMEGKDPVKAVKEGLAKALVFYYPLAGRLRTAPGHKLVVDCTGEGVLFIEAEADARLEDFGDEIHPPFPLDDLLYDVPGAQDIVGTPLFIVQFLNAVGEMARGLASPSVPHVWQRERLSARAKPLISYAHHEYDESKHPHEPTYDQNSLAHRSILFGPTEVAALRSHVPADDLKGFSTFDILSATLWRCRTAALELNPSEEVRLLFAVNARSKFDPPLPNGYYGNACAFPVACATAGEICDKPLSYALDLIKQTKLQVTEEYMRSVADLLVFKNKPPFTVDNTYVVSDLRHLGFSEVDFGWGKPAFGGPANNGSVPDASFFLSFKNKKGDSVIMVPMVFPVNSAMDRFVAELDGMLKHKA